MKDNNKDLESLDDKVSKILDKAETDMNNAIDEYNEKYEEDEDATIIDTTDLHYKFVELNDFIEDQT
tara:strand:+ start:61 stop:261 length:201 start_codon:yes stop_codon:yes gene_type:complete